MKPWRISKKEKNLWLSKGPKINEVFNNLECQHKLSAGVHREVETAIAIACKFNTEVLRPIYLEMDIKCMEDGRLLTGGRYE